MKNIERKYAYYDEGNLPVTGEDGVTYLTLYSSEAGNTYDGWIWDPDRIHYSETERTFGYRYPNDHNYCWDDEVIVDLSNAQNRKEASEYETGRITSYNTNVSDRPIVLNDIDILGLTEEERESKATTVLFTAIPLIKTAYIHAEIEVSMKMNISPDNTNGNVRVEAFYILNNESDRVMRPNPVNHYTVTKENEYHIMRLMYWNPAVNHENHNYIGVKLLVTGGTAEIGISSNPAYGDAIITVASNGMTGDHIESGQPESISISGKSLVPYGYKLRPGDYTVLCTYDTDEVYNVSSCCTFYPEMWTEVTEPAITLTAEYMGLYASMTVQLADVDHIELLGIEDIYDNYNLNIDDFMVLAYFEDGEWMEVTDQCTFSPAMGTLITQDTVLTATYTPSWMEGASFIDSLTLTKHNMVAQQQSSHTGGRGLVYTLYDNDLVEITGNADIYSSDLGNHIVDTDIDAHECIDIPTFSSELSNRNFSVKWNAEGTPSGIKSTTSHGYSMITTFLGFNDIHFTALYTGRIDDPSVYPEGYFQSILIDLHNQEELTSDELSFLNNVDDYPVIRSRNTNYIHNYYQMFYGMTSLRSIDFTKNWNTSLITDMNNMCFELPNLEKVDGLSDWDVSNVTNMEEMFAYCTSLSDISGLKKWNVSNVTRMYEMFRNCTSLESIHELSLWNLSSLESAGRMFLNAGLKNLVGTGTWVIGNNRIQCTAQQMFSNTKIDDLIGLGKNIFTNCLNLSSVFYSCENLESLSGGEGVDVHNATTMEAMFSHCLNLEDISAISDWRVFNVRSMKNMFSTCPKLLRPMYIANWDVSNCEDFSGMFGIPSLTEENYYFDAYGLFDDTNISKQSVNISRINTSATIYDEKTGISYRIFVNSMFQGYDAFNYYKPTQTITYRHEQSLPSWYKAYLDQEIPNIWPW